MKNLIYLFVSFFKIGILTFGGGYAMLPMIQKEIVEKHGWATDEEIMDYYAVGQCTPGIIAVNTATFIGYYRSGVLGSIFATLGVITPSLIIITIIAAFIQGYSDVPAVQYAFSGITAAVAVLIISAVIKLWKSGIKNVWGGLVFAAALTVKVIFEVSAIFIVLAAVILGLLLQMIKSYRGKKA